MTRMHTSRCFHRRFLALVAVAAIVLAGCASRPDAHDGNTYVLVRHAEKAVDGGRDPSLSPAGEARAQSLADSLLNAPLKAVYATAYRRTQSTAAPAAQAHGLSITTYDAQQPASAFAAQLRQQQRGTVLIVGHSNTVPAIASALCGCPVATMGEDEYDRRVIVHIDSAGRAALHEDRY